MTYTPVDLHRTCEKRHGVRLDPDAVDAELFALYGRGSGPTKWVEDRVGPSDVEPVEIFADQMRRE